MAAEIIRLDRVTKVYGTGDAAVTAVAGASLRIAEGDFVTVIGPSGSGKSTLMHILGCLDVPTSGDYSFVVSPSHATKYRVLIANGPTSQVLTVYVLDKRLSLNCNLCHGGNTPGSHTLTVTASFRRPAGPAGNKGPVYLYYALNSSSATPNILNQVASAPRHFVGNTFSLSVSATVQFPNSTFQFGEAFCWKDNEAASGVGLPGHHGCGDATINRLHYLG